MCFLVLSACLAGCSSLRLSEPGEPLRDPASAVLDGKQVPEGDAIDARHLQAKADYHFTLGDAYALEGNVDKAVEELRHALVYDDRSVTIRLRLAAEYIKKGLISEALEQVEASVEIRPDSVEAHFLLGSLYSAMKSYEKAETEYRAVLRISPGHSESRLMLGAVLAEQKKWEEAFSTLTALAQDPDAKEPHLAWFYLGRIQVESGLPSVKKQAFQSFRSALKAKPAFAEAAVVVADTLVRDKKRVEAKTLLRTFQTQHGPNAPVAAQLARLAMEDEDYPLALEQLGVIAGADPENVNVRVKMALILMEQKRFAEAVQHLEAVLALSPGSDKIQFYLAAVFEELGRTNDAIREYLKLSPDSPFFSEAMLHAAYLHKTQKRYDEAIRVISDALEYKQDVMQFYLLKASFQDDIHDYKGALQTLQAGAEKDSNHPQIHFFLGSIYDKLGDRAQVLRHLERTLELDGGHVHALNYLAYTLAEAGEHLERAEELALRAMSKMPGDGFILDTYGWVLFRKGEWQKAMAVAEKAHKLQPDEAIIAEHLGDIYLKAQLAEKARRMYELAIEKETNVITRRKLREKLAAVDDVRPRMRASQTEDAGTTRSPASESP